MKRQEVSQIIAEKYRDYAGRAIRHVKALGSLFDQAEDPWADPWEVFKSQFEDPDRLFFDDCEKAVKSACQQVVVSLPEHELKLLWLSTDAYFDQQGLAFASSEEMAASVAERVYLAVCDLAAEEKLVE